MRFIDREEIWELQKRLEAERSKEDIVICTIEEMSEVTKVLTKYLRGSHKFSREDLTEEVAHAILMLETVKHVFELSDDDYFEQQLLALYKCFSIKT